MKKGMLFLGMLGLSVMALGYQEPGALPRTASTFAPLQNYLQGSTGKVNDFYLLPKMIKGQTLRIRLLVLEDYEPELSLENIKENIASSYQQWFEETASWIRRQKREMEFADVLQILDRGVKVEFVDENPDISFLIQPLQNIQDQLGYWGYYVQEFGGTASIWLAGDVTPSEQVGNANKKEAEFYKELAQNDAKRLNFYKRETLHEIGHSIAFADMYVGGRLNSDQIYGSVKSPSDIPSIMDELTFKSVKKEPHLSCDDATGMINLIDITNGYTQRGGEKGWRSLCPKSKEYFIHNISGLKGSYRVQLAGKNKVLIGTYKGEVILTEYPFADEMITPFEGVSVSNDGGEEGPETDALGRLVHGKTVGEDDIYINHLYEQRTLAVVNGQSQVAYFRIDNTLKNKRKTIWLFNQNGKINELELTWEGDAIYLNLKRGTVDEENNWVQITSSVKRYYDKKGNPKNIMENKQMAKYLPRPAAQDDALAVQVQHQIEQEKKKDLIWQLDMLVKRWIDEKVR